MLRFLLTGDREIAGAINGDLSMEVLRFIIRFRSSDDEQMDEVGQLRRALRHLFVYWPISFAIEAWCLSKLWEWFAVSRGLPEITYKDALLVGVAATLFRNGSSTTNIMAPLCLLVGWVIHINGWL